jgi:hypothetical protein
LGFAAALSGCATSSAGEMATSRSNALALGVQLEDRYGPGNPFSRNFALWPASRLSGPVTRMTSAEEEALIARAITEHEMRRP